MLRQITTDATAADINVSERTTTNVGDVSEHEQHLLLDNLFKT